MFILNFIVYISPHNISAIIVVRNKFQQISKYILFYLKAKLQILAHSQIANFSISHGFYKKTFMNRSAKRELRLPSFYNELIGTESFSHSFLLFFRPQACVILWLVRPIIKILTFHCCSSVQNLGDWNYRFYGK